MALCSIKLTFPFFAAGTGPSRAAGSSGGAEKSTMPETGGAIGSDVFPAFFFLLFFFFWCGG